ncbi:MAG: PilZ domain-containing protein, partial [Candidatus Eremiobacteraeota bacterium]|nr:PilZ domain-containing protein [Candidatus Eremiobacteraeota bacterium]
TRLRLDEYPRLEFGLTVEGESAGEHFTGVTKNIGASGLVLLSENALPEAQPLSLTISLPNRKISITGVVLKMCKEKGIGRRRKPVQYEMEIYIEKISPDDQEFLIRFVTERLTKKESSLPGLKKPGKLL